MRRLLGNAVMLLGIGAILAAAVLVVGNLRTETQAGRTAKNTMDQILMLIPTEPAKASEPTQPRQESTFPTAPKPEEIPDHILNPQMDMPEKVIDGIAYIGYLEIPALGLTLPIITRTTGSYLQIAPCRFAGSAYLDNMVLGAHNYSTHFGKLNTLSPGEPVIFTDMDGNVFFYEVSDFEVLQPDQAEALCTGDWDLTLYTCTIGGRTRVTVRCQRTEA